MHKFIVVVSVLFVGLLLTACQNVVVYNSSSVPSVELNRVERAVTIQLHIMRQYWGTPDVAFGTTGWPVVLATPPTSNALSYHNGGPSAYVWTADGHTSVVSSGAPLPWSVVFSHEMIEMFGNPSDKEQISSWPKELADPVLRVPVTIDGVQVSDFVLPAWFGSSQGPWDYAGALKGPYQTIR